MKLFDEIPDKNNKVKSYIRNSYDYEIKFILTSYSDVIAISSDDLEPSKLLPHHIELLEGSKPIKQKAYRISQVQLLALKEELKKLIDKGLISPSHFTLVFTYYFSAKEKW